MLKNDPFPKPGEICWSCADRWEKKGQDPIKLIALPKRTENYFFNVAACLYCDGPVAEIAFATDKKKKEEKK